MSTHGSFEFQLMSPDVAVASEIEATREPVLSYEEREEIAHAHGAVALFGVNLDEFGI